MWRRWAFILSALEFVAPQLRAQAAQQPTGRIVGTVYCTDTHPPSRGAVIFLQTLSTKEHGDAGSVSLSSTRVAIDGTYAFEYVGLGRYRIMASLPGYYVTDVGSQPERPGTSTRDFENDAAVSVEGNGTSRMDIALERGAGISGRVLYDDGSPASQVSIIVEEAMKNDELSARAFGEAVSIGDIARAIVTPRRMETDDMGRFRIAGLHSGSCYVAAIQPSFGGPGQFGVPHSGQRPADCEFTAAVLFTKAQRRSMIYAQETKSPT